MCAWVHAHARCNWLVNIMEEQGNRQQSTRIVVTIVLLVLLALGFFVASFFVLA